MHRARGALADAAPEFCAGEFQRIAKDPEQWCIRLHVDRAGLTVHIQRVFAHGIVGGRNSVGRDKRNNRRPGQGVAGPVAA